MPEKLLLFIFCCFIGYAAGAQDTVKVNKRTYHLFHATPKRHMREMETDRPDITESAYTVDAGHFQLESDAFKVSRNKQGNMLFIQNSFNKANIKLGITNTADIQLVVESYVQNKTKNLTTNEIADNYSGFGDLTVRYKRNLWGNDTGKTAFAVMPFITILTSGFSTDNAIEGGVIFPLAVAFKNNWGMSIQLEADLIKNDMNSDYHSEIAQSLTLSKKINDKLESFAESFYTYNFKENQFNLYLDAGVVLALTDNFNLDAGINYGISENADKVYFVGFSFRY